MMSLGTDDLPDGHMTQVTTKYEWTICNYTQCYKAYSIDEYVTSPKFFSGSKAEFEWRLKLYPKGLEKAKEGSISLFFESLNKFKVKTSFILSCLQKQPLQKTEVIFEPYYGYGHSEFFIKENNLEGQLKSFNDTLTINCEIFNVDIVDSLDNQNKSAKFNMIKDISKLLEETNFCDVTIIIDKKEFLAHKVILAARSEVFAAMFKNDFIEKQNSMVEINDTEHQIFEELLRFIYTGEVKNLEITAKDLLIVADKYAIQELKSLCIDEVCKSINLNNAVNLLLYADLYTVKLLRKKAIQFITTHAKNPTSLSEFNLLETKPKLLTELFFKLASEHIK